MYMAPFLAFKLLYVSRTFVGCGLNMTRKVIKMWTSSDFVAQVVNEKNIDVDN